MTEIKVCSVVDSAIELVFLGIVVCRDGNEYIGPLFKKLDDRYIKVLKVVEECKIDYSDRKLEDSVVYEVFKNLCEKHNIPLSEDYYRLVRYWSYINGFTDIYHEGCPTELGEEIWRGRKIK